MFLHRGIAARQFQRAFVLAEGIDVKGAWLDNGLLHIELARPQPETRVKTIKIGVPLAPNGTPIASRTSMQVATHVAEGREEETIDSVE